MKSLLPLVERAMAAFNHAWFWRGECRVWGQRMSSGTFDRWLYLRLHRFDRMGRDERKALERIVRPGMTVLDVGSNIGLYTVLLSRLVGPAGRVISFEPDPELFVQQQKNFALNGCRNVEAHNLAVGSHRDRLVLRRLILNSGDNTLGSGGSNLFRREITTEVVALDEFLPDLRPDLVKVDVQGWELEVLRGMAQVLAASPHTALYLEFWPEGFQRAGYTAADLIAFLTQRNFTVRRAEDPTGLPLDQAALAALTRDLTHLKHADLYATRHHQNRPPLEACNPLGQPNPDYLRP